MIFIHYIILKVYVLQNVRSLGHQELTGLLDFLLTHDIPLLVIEGQRTFVKSLITFPLSKIMFTAAYLKILV